MKVTRETGAGAISAPTGVGKTELAKTITSLLFGDESAYSGRVRFIFGYPFVKDRPARFKRPVDYDAQR
jgi:hypothetical protein